MAAPVFRNVDPNWHRSDLLHKECEWKQGVPAAYQIRQANKQDAVAPLARSTLRVSRLQNLPGKANATGICLPPVGRQPGLWSPRSKSGLYLTRPSLLMEAATVKERQEASFSTLLEQTIGELLEGPLNVNILKRILTDAAA